MLTAFRAIRDGWRSSRPGRWAEFQSSGTIFIWPSRLMRAMLSAFPKWLLYVWMILRFVPTPFEVDEWAPGLVALFLIILPAISYHGGRLVFNWHRLGRWRSAWRGAKSHRAWDRRPFKNITIWDQSIQGHPTCTS